MEVFSISGWGGGLGAASCPAGWVVTPNGNCGGSAAAGYKHPQATALQQALNTKGAGLVVDGVIGPLTATAVNRALGVNLALSDVAAQAALLTNRVLTTGATSIAPVIKPSVAIGPAVITPLPVQVMPGELPRGGGWALVALNAMVAGVGAYFITTR